MADDDDIAAMRALAQQLLAAADRREAASRAAPAPSYLTVKQAAAVAADLACHAVSASSVRRWCIDFKVGHQMPSGSWLVDEARLRDHVLARAVEGS